MPTNSAVTPAHRSVEFYRHDSPPVAATGATGSPESVGPHSLDKAVADRAMTEASGLSVVTPGFGVPHLAGGTELSPNSERMRGSSNALLNEMALFLERHPSFADSLRSPTKRAWLAGSPTRGWRPIYRRTFYVLIVVALLGVTLKVNRVAAQGAEVKLEVDREKAVLASRSAELSLEKQQMKSAIAGNVLLMGLNVLIAVRGVRIWALLKRVGFEGWVHSIARNLPWTRRAVRVLNYATLPFRQAIRPLRLPFHLRAQAQQAAREAAAREAAARSFRPLTQSAQAVTGVAAFTERKLRGVVRGALRSLEVVVR